MTSSHDRTQVFISYSHKDEKYLEGLLPHLRYYERNKLLDFWADTKIKPGAEWQTEIRNALASAIVAVLLISVDFLDSQYIQDNELLTLLIAAEKEGVTILPVILRPCSLPESISRFQAFNSASMPVAKMKGYQREDLWVKVANAIVSTIASQKGKGALIQKKLDLSGIVADEHEAEKEQVPQSEVQEEPTQGNDLTDQKILIKQGVGVWNEWRQKYPDIKPDLSGINLSRLDLSNANLTFTNLVGANLETTILVGANLSYSDLRDANLHSADFRSAKLTMAFLQNTNLEAAILIGADCNRANLSKGDLSESDLSGANLSEAILIGANLSRANLSEVNLEGANLKTAILSETNLERANLTNCLIYGISAWDVQLQGTIQNNLVITPLDQPTITVDNLKLAQFLYLLLNQKEVRNIIDIFSTKTVLILGSFMAERKVMLDALQDALRSKGYLPMFFDFEKPESRDITETISTLAHLARFIIADMTDAKSIPQELAYIVPQLPSVPVQPLLLASASAFGMFEYFNRYPWVLPLHLYKDQASLLQSLEEKVIAPAEQKSQELAKR